MHIGREVCARATGERGGSLWPRQEKQGPLVPINQGVAGDSGRRGGRQGTSLLEETPAGPRGRPAPGRAAGPGPGARRGGQRPERGARAGPQAVEVQAELCRHRARRAPRRGPGQPGAALRAGGSAQRSEQEGAQRGRARAARSLGLLPHTCPPRREGAVFDVDGPRDVGVAGHDAAGVAREEQLLGRAHDVPREHHDQHVAQVELQRRLRRQDQDLVPQAQVQVGAGLQEHQEHVRAGALPPLRRERTRHL